MLIIHKCVKTDASFHTSMSHKIKQPHFSSHHSECVCLPDILSAESECHRYNMTGTSRVDGQQNRDINIIFT